MYIATATQVIITLFQALIGLLASNGCWCEHPKQ
jgi:hypothetical protein